MKKLLILLTLWCSTITANAALITIDVEDKAYDINDTLTADIYISELENNFGAQELISLFSFDLIFNENLLDVDNVIFGDKLDVDSFGDPSVRTDTFTAGQPFTLGEAASAFFTDLEFAQIGFTNFLLVSVDFTVKGAGLAEFSLNNAEVYDDFTFLLSSISTQGDRAQLGSQVSVPEPSSMAIFALALLMLVRLTRKAQH